jgi:hypothetical protein
MAKIKYTSASPKAGTIEHIDNATAATLVAAGFAEIVPAIRRGEKGWLEERLAQSALVTAPGEHDTVAGVRATEWGIHQSGKVVAVIKRVGSDTFFFDTPPADTPRSIVQQFLDVASASPEANAVAIAAAKAAQDEQARKDKWSGQRVVRTAIFGSKPL